MSKVQKVDRPVNLGLGQSEVTTAFEDKSPLRSVGKESLVEGTVVVDGELGILLKLARKRGERVRGRLSI